MRNPWGTGEWNGEYSDNWEGWTPELIEATGFKFGDDGKFWMPLD